MSVRLRIVTMAVLLLCALVSRGEELSPRFTADGLYNQGNAFARGGQPGMAVLNYQRARLLSPSDDDVAANLRTVLESQHLAVPASSWLEPLAFLQAPSVAAISGLLGLLLLGAVVVSGHGLAPRWVRGTVAAVGATLAGLPVMQAVLLWPLLHAGVIIARESPVRESPVPMAAVLFVLPEASTVAVDEVYENFTLIQAPGGRSGWVASTNLERVAPTIALRPGRIR